MHTYLRAIGFRDCRNRHQFEEIYRHTLNEPNRKIRTTISAGTSLLQVEKDYGKGFGLSLIGEYDDQDSLYIEHSFPYLKGSHPMQFESIKIQKQADKESYAGLCEDYRLGTSVIFYLLNISDYAKSKWLNYSNRTLTKVRFSALATEGVILHGIYRTMDQLVIESADHRRKKNLLKKAHDGDAGAMEELSYDEMNTYSSLSTRIKKEDILSIVDTCFMPCGVECDHYLVIGTIYSVEELQNSYTGETIFNMTIEANSILMNVCINKADLLGEPLNGRRFRGEIWLQGTVEI